MYKKIIIIGVAIVLGLSLLCVFMLSREEGQDLGAELKEAQEEHPSKDFEEASPEMLERLNKKQKTYETKAEREERKKVEEEIKEERSSKEAVEAMELYYDLSACLEQNKRLTNN